MYLRLAAIVHKCDIPGIRHLALRWFKSQILPLSWVDSAVIFSSQCQRQNCRGLTAFIKTRYVYVLIDYLQLLGKPDSFIQKLGP